MLSNENAVVRIVVRRAAGNHVDNTTSHFPDAVLVVGVTNYF